MPETKVEELERIRARVSATLEAYPNGLPGEKSAECDEAMKRARELRGEIQQEQEAKAKRAEFSELVDYLDKPQHHVPHGSGEVDNSPEGMKALKSMGWEIKNGIISAPTSKGTMQDMYPEDVLFGPMPDDDVDALKFFQATRATHRPEYRPAYLKLFRSVGRFHGDFGMAWSTLQTKEQKALSEGTDSAGGFLVPPDTQAELLVRKAQMAAVRRAGARVQTTSRDILQYPMVQAATATAGGLASGGGSVFSSGFIGGVAGETPTSVDVDAAFGNLAVPVKKIRVFTRLSNDFIADAAVNILAFLSQNGAENMALVEDNEFLSGDGSALHPLGILNGGLTTVDVEGSTTDTISNTNAATGSAPKIIDVEYGLPSQYVQNAVWMMRRSIEGKVRKLVDGNGRFLWPIYGGYQMPTHDIDGYPIYNSEFMPADGTNANKVILFGDFSGYIIAERAQVSTTILRERYADSDQTGIIIWERVGGAVWNSDSFRVGIV